MLKHSDWVEVIESIEGLNLSCLQTLGETCPARIAAEKKLEYVKAVLRSLDAVCARCEERRGRAVMLREELFRDETGKSFSGFLF